MVYSRRIYIQAIHVELKKLIIKILLKLYRFQIFSINPCMESGVSFLKFLVWNACFGRERHVIGLKRVFVCLLLKKVSS